MSAETFGGYEVSSSTCGRVDCGKDAQFRATISTNGGLGAEDYYLCADHLGDRANWHTVTPLVTNVKILTKEQDKPALKPLEFTDPKTGMVENIAPGDLTDFIGKTMTMMDGERVKIETIVGSAFRETRFEVNGKHHIVILDAFKQLHNDRSITQAQIDKFDQLEVERIVRVKDSSGPVATQSLPRFDA